MHALTRVASQAQRSPALSVSPYGSPPYSTGSSTPVHHLLTVAESVAATTQQAQAQAAQRAASARAAKRRRADEQADEADARSDHSEHGQQHDEDNAASDEDSGQRTGSKKGRTAGGASHSEDKRKKRQQQNRDAAATSRNRKKAYLTGLEKQVAQVRHTRSWSIALVLLMRVRVFNPCSPVLLIGVICAVLCCSCRARTRV